MLKCNTLNGLKTVCVQERFYPLRTVRICVEPRDSPSQQGPPRRAGVTAPLSFCFILPTVNCILPTVVSPLTLSRGPRPQRAPPLTESSDGSQPVALSASLLSLAKTSAVRSRLVYHDQLCKNERLHSLGSSSACDKK